MKLSIIVPVYNVQDYLAKCLESLLNTEWQDYEIVIVNDGSTDDSPSIALKYAQEHQDRVRYCSTPNGGLGHARRIGMDMATGEWLMFVDSDDTLAEGALDEIRNTLNTDSDIIIFDFLNVRADGSVVSRGAGADREGTFTLAEYPQLLMALPNACNKLYKRLLFLENDLSYPSRVWFEDLHTTPKILFAADKITYLPKAWYLYLQRDGSITKNKKTDRNLEIISAVDDVLEWYRERGAFEQYADELEYMTYYNQLLTTTTRVNGIDPDSPVQEVLRQDFERKFPNWRNNIYIQRIPAKYRLLNFLIFHRHYRVLNLVMRANDKVRH